MSISFFKKNKKSGKYISRRWVVVSIRTRQNRLYCHRYCRFLSPKCRLFLRTIRIDKIGYIRCKQCLESEIGQ